MLTIKFIRENQDLLVERLQVRNLKAEEIAENLKNLITLDDQRRDNQTQSDQILSENNKAAKLIGQLYKEGKREEAEELKNQVVERKEKINALQDQQKTVFLEMEQLLLNLPNMPHPSVPAGNTDEDNELFKPCPTALPVLPDDAVPHWDLVQKYNLIDFELGVKITGAGFPLFRGKGARLERALINMFLDEAAKAGFEEIVPPLMVNEASARGTGQLPDKEGQMYYMEKDDLYLIPTAEVPITNIYRDVILDEKDFPIKLTGYTPCFRREAGAHGKDVRGLNRVHQFDKVEIVQIEHPNKSYETLMEMLNHIEGLLQKLELPYRILRLCGGDLGFTAALTFDFEVYSAAQKRWLEVSSVSNFETFQSNRLKLRFRDENKKMQLAHTLNGSALALARIVAALLENNQTEEGIKIPEALQPYTGFAIID